VLDLLVQQQVLAVLGGGTRWGTWLSLSPTWVCYRQFAGCRTDTTSRTPEKEGWPFSTARAGFGRGGRRRGL